VREHEPIERIADRAGEYLEGPTLAAVPESDAARAFRDAVRAGDSAAVADRFRHAVIPQPP
jgi:septum site-determining protein MinD